jgi:hypothetical protein
MDISIACLKYFRICVIISQWRISRGRVLKFTRFCLQHKMGTGLCEQFSPSVHKVAFTRYGVALALKYVLERYCLFYTADLPPFQNHIVLIHKVTRYERLLETQTQLSVWTSPSQNPHFDAPLLHTFCRTSKTEIKTRQTALVQSWENNWARSRHWGIDRRKCIWNSCKA